MLQRKVLLQREAWQRKAGAYREDLGDLRVLIKRSEK